MDSNNESSTLDISPQNLNDTGTVTSTMSVFSTVGFVSSFRSSCYKVCQHFGTEIIDLETNVGSSS